MVPAQGMPSRNQGALGTGFQACAIVLSLVKWPMTDFDRKDPRLDVDLRAATAELRVLRTALESAREEARKANVSAHRAERALEKAQAREDAQKRLARELGKKYKAAEKKYKAAEKLLKEYDRVTSTIAWKLYSPFDRALHRARSRWDRRARRPKPTLGPESSTSANLERATNSLEDDGYQTEIIGNEGHQLNSAEQVKGVEFTELDGGTEPSAFIELSSTKTACLSTSVEPDLSPLRALLPRGRIAVVLHLYYPELWPEFRDALRAMPEPFDLFVTLTAGYSDQAADWIRVSYPSAQIITLENRGRDILPFVTLINSGVLFRYELVCKLHTKRSIQRNPGDTWRRDLVAGVLADPGYVERVLRAFAADPKLGGVVGNEFYRRERDWSRHMQRVNELCSRIGVATVTEEAGCPGYPAGSIYWIRASLLRPIADLGLTAAEFEPEPLPRDGYKTWTTSCLVDAIERLIGQICSETGMYIAEGKAIGSVRL